MRKFIISVIMLLVIGTASCDKPIAKQLTFSTQHETIIACEEGPAGICGKYDWSFNKGHYKYWYGLHLQCPGHKRVMEKLDEWRTTYQKSDGSTYIEDSHESTIVANLTECR